jgi:uncharacterized protein involved in tolerance to divalent cations
VITDTEEQANDIVDFLLERNMLLEAVLLEKVSVRKKRNSNKIENVKRTLIMGKTKALLFNTIDELLKEKYEDDMPIIYSLPIVHMDWEQSKQLVNDVAKV